MAEDEEVNKRIAELEARLQAGAELTGEEERWLLKHRDGLSDTEIEFIMNGLPNQDGDVIH